jgi:hypothetical protein
MTTHSTTDHQISRAPRKRRQWRSIDTQSAALGVIGDVSVELGNRTYRVVLNCRSTDSANESIIHGSGHGTTP